MKLQSKINRYRLLFAIIMSLIAVIVIFFIANYFGRYHNKSKLLYVKEKYIQRAQTENLVSIKALIEVKETIKPELETSEKFRDTTIYLNAERKKRTYLLYDFPLVKNGKHYIITIFYPITEKDDIVSRGLGVGVGIVFIFLLIITLSGIPNRVFKRIWEPFYRTLADLKKYHLAQSEPIVFSKTDISEFEELHKALNILIMRIRNDYLNLKEFTENASHEIQTPLAIISAKLDLLFQNETLSEDQLIILQDINSAVFKLSKLIQSLLTLAKIENKQFKESGQINFAELIHKQLDELSDVIEMRHIQLERRIISERIISINPYLTDILIRNLLKNAILYCGDPYKIIITLDNSGLSIANSGEELAVSPERIFDRFVKNNPSSESLGLGLAIVKKICEIYGMPISYSYKNKFHEFKITF